MPDSRRNATPRRRFSGHRTPPIALEVAAATLVPAAAFGFSRIFETVDDAVPVMVTALASTVLAVVLRRLRIPLLAAAPISALVLYALLLWRYAPGTATYGLWPTDDTRAVVRGLLDQAVVDFREERAPAPALDSFVAPAMVAAWVAAFLTDWGALRLRLAFEPVIPAALLYVFTAVLGNDERQAEALLLLGAAVLAWAVTQRTVNLAQNGRWLHHQRLRGPLSIVPGAAVLGALALVAGTAVGPRLPGAGATELIDYRTSTDPDRTVISPFVSIEAQLVEQRDSTLFVVETDEPSYWRLAGLDTYQSDRAEWTVSRNFESRAGALPGGLSAGAESRVLTQRFRIEGLSDIWLPAAFTPVEIEAFSGPEQEPVPVGWNADTSSLTVSGDRDDAATLDYEVISVVPAFSAAELAAAPSAVPEAVAQDYLELPGDLPARVAEEAAAITSGSANRYEQMLALQDYFRAFDYSLELSPRNAEPIGQFLDERVGFCQQFAGTFALMARTLGAPSRVAVGFTWGDPVAGEPGSYEVSGRQAHAWPEIYFDGLGWVSFEPTPGRGSPAGVSYTNVPAVQDSESAPTLADTEEAAQATTTTVDPTEFQPTIPDDFTLDPGADLPTAGAEDDPGFPPALIGGLAVAIAVAAVLGSIWWVIGRGLSAARDPRGRIDVAWATVVAWLERRPGVGREDSETRSEFGRRAAGHHRIDDDRLAELGELATMARYAPDVPDDAADRAEELAAGILDRRRARRGRKQRLWDLADPRWIWRMGRISRSSRPSPEAATPIGWPTTSAGDPHDPSPTDSAPLPGRR